MIKGQLVKISYSVDNSWYFGVVLDVFDDKQHIVTELGQRLMLHSNPTEDDKQAIDPTINCSPLLRDGKPVMCKRSLFGRYEFKPED